KAEHVRICVRAASGHERDVRVAAAHEGRLRVFANVHALDDRRWRWLLWRLLFVWRSAWRSGGRHARSDARDASDRIRMRFGRRWTFVTSRDHREEQHELLHAPLSGDERRV